MARLSFTFGEVSPASSIGKVKAVSVLKLPRTLETSTQSSLGKVKAVSVLKLPRTQLVSTLTGKVTTFPVLKSSAPTQSSLGKVKARATLKSPQNNQLKNTENINKSKFSVRSDTIDSELLSSTINKRLIIAKSLAYNITPSVINKPIVSIKDASKPLTYSTLNKPILSIKGFTNNIQVKDVNSINKSKFNASGDNTITKVNFVNKGLVVKGFASYITPSVINKPIVSIKDASTSLNYSFLIKPIQSIKGFTNNIQVKDVNSINKSKFSVLSDTIDTELLSSTINKRLIIAKSLAYNITPSVINKPIVSIKDASKPLTYSTLNKPILSIKGFTNNIQVKDVNSINKSKFNASGDNTITKVNFVNKGLVVKGFASYITPSVINKPIVSIKDASTSLTYSTLNKGLVVKGFTNNILQVKDVNSINKSKFDASGVNVITKVNFVNKGFVVRELPNNIKTVNKLIIPMKAVTVPYYNVANIISNTSQSSVSTKVAPTNARENLYYAIMSPGKRGVTTYNTTSSYDLIKDNNNINMLNKPINNMKGLIINLTTNVLNKPIVSIKELPNNIKTVNKLIIPMKAVTVPYYNVANINLTIDQSSVSTKVAPTNARENLYYAIMSPGKRGTSFLYNSLNPPVNNLTYSTLNKPIVSIKGFTYKFNLEDINKSKFDARSDTIDTEILTNNFVNKGFVVKDFSNNIQLEKIESVNKGFVVKGFNQNRISTNIIAKYTATQIYELKFNTSVNNVAKFKVLGTYGEKNNKLKPENLSLYSPIDNLNVLENSIEIISLSSNSTSKTLFFQNQTVQKFFAGDIVKIKNSSTSYIDYVTVNSANNNSITYTSSNISPTVSETFIESGTTVYSKLLSTTVGPYPLRNFNISYSTPGKKSNKSLGFGNESAASSDQAVGVKKAPIQFWS